jgi:hypothetical protein
MYDLNSLVDPGSDWTITMARDINELGWIAASGINLNTGELHGLLLTPEPATLSLLALGSLAALLRRRGRIATRPV